MTTKRTPKSSSKSSKKTTGHGTSHKDSDRESTQVVEEYTCTVKELPAEHMVAAATTAIEQNPSNAPRLDLLPTLLVGLITSPAHLALLTQKYWGAKGVDLGVSFMETTSTELRDKILAFANKWGDYGNIKFRWSQSGGQIRISRGPGGYYSYLGTDILHIPRNQQTMNLEQFSLQTPDSEYNRVVTHEFGHTLGFPHEHMRREIIARLDVERTVAYFQRTQGWDRQTVMQQVLTPLEDAALIATPQADETSVMTYSLPAVITKDGRPIKGGAGIEATDAAFVAKLYPKENAPPPPSSGKTRFILEFDAENVPVPRVSQG